MVWTNTSQIIYTVIAFNNDGKVRYRVVNENTRTVTLNLNNSYTNIPANSIYDLTANGGLRSGNNEISTTSSSDNLILQYEVINTAPTQPGAFTQPTGELEIGDIRTINWGASTDAEGGNLYYFSEYKVNNGTWTGINPGWYVNTSATSFVIPTANTLQFRVKARDEQGLETPYRESPTYTVTKPKYYWSEYNIAYTSGYIYESNADQPLQLANANGWYPNWNIYESSTYNPATQKAEGVRFVATVSSADLFNVPGGFAGNYAMRVNWGNENEIYLLSSGVTGSLGTNNASRNTRFVQVVNPSNSRGSFIQSGLIAVEGTYPLDGIHTDGFWYVRGSRVNNSIPPTGAFTAPTPTAVLKPGQGVAVTFAASTAPNISLYEMDYRYNAGLWTTLGTNNTALTRSFTPTTDKTLTNVQFRVRAKNTSNVYSDYVYSETFNIEHNAKPTLTLTTANNLILAETNTMVVAGQALDTDTGNVVNVYYQINTGNNVAIATGISNGTAPLPFTKTLTFKEGKLLDGTTVIASNLVETQTYTLKVWSEDNQGGKSDVQTRSFKVIPNRAPLLTVATITQKTGLINNDTIAVTGTVTDPENQTVKVKYKINGGTLIQGYSGAGGNFSFNIKAGDLLTGDNTIEFQGSDTYDLITTKKYKFTKVKNAEKLLKSVVRYKVTVPVVGTTGIVTWIERENGDLTVAPDLSMRMTGETELYTAMEKQVTAPVNDTVTEDQYRLTPASAKTDVTLKLTLTKTAAASDKGVKKITGALQ